MDVINWICIARQFNGTCHWYKTFLDVNRTNNQKSVSGKICLGKKIKFVRLCLKFDSSCRRMIAWAQYSSFEPNSLASGLQTITKLKRTIIRYLYRSPTNSPSNLPPPFLILLRFSSRATKDNGSNEMRIKTIWIRQSSNLFSLQTLEY